MVATGARRTVSAKPRIRSSRHRVIPSWRHRVRAMHSTLSDSIMITERMHADPRRAQVYTDPDRSSRDTPAG